MEVRILKLIIRQLKYYNALNNISQIEMIDTDSIRVIA